MTVFGWKNAQMDRQNKEWSLQRVYTVIGHCCRNLVAKKIRIIPFSFVVTCLSSLRGCHSLVKFCFFQIVFVPPSLDKKLDKKYIVRKLNHFQKKGLICWNNIVSIPIMVCMHHNYFMVERLIYSIAELKIIRSVLEQNKIIKIWYLISCQFLQILNVAHKFWLCFKSTP